MKKKKKRITDSIEDLNKTACLELSTYWFNEYVDSVREMNDKTDSYTEFARNNFYLYQSAYNGDYIL